MKRKDMPAIKPIPAWKVNRTLKIQHLGWRGLCVSKSWSVFRSAYQLNFLWENLLTACLVSQTVAWFPLGVTLSVGRISFTDRLSGLSGAASKLPRQLAAPSDFYLCLRIDSQFFPEALI